jgi:hypothetical protein
MFELNIYVPEKERERERKMVYNIRQYIYYIGCVSYFDYYKLFQKKFLFFLKSIIFKKKKETKRKKENQPQYHICAFIILYTNNTHEEKR